MDGRTMLAECACGDPQCAAFFSSLFIFIRRHSEGGFGGKIFLQGVVGMVGVGVKGTGMVGVGMIGAGLVGVGVIGIGMVGAGMVGVGMVGAGMVGVGWMLGV